MSLLSDLEESWADEEALDDLAHEEARCLVDALAMAVYADFEINEYEAEELHELVDDMSWSWVASIVNDGYTAEALASAAKVSGEDALTDYADRVAAGLPEEAYESVFRMMVGITAADGEINEDERMVLGAFAYAFAFSEETMGDIFDEVAAANRI